MLSSFLTGAAQLVLPLGVILCVILWFVLRQRQRRFPNVVAAIDEPAVEPPAVEAFDKISWSGGAASLEPFWSVEKPPQILRLAGHVDRVDKFVIAGWAMSDDDPDYRPEVQIVQLGKVLHSCTPLFDSPRLRSARKLPAAKGPPTYAWRLWLPLANGVVPDVPFSIVFRETGAALTLGADRQIALIEECDQGALDDIDKSTFFFPSYNRSERGLRFEIALEQPQGSPQASLKIGERLSQPSGQETTFRDKQMSRFSFDVTQDEVDAFPGCALPIVPASMAPPGARRLHLSIHVPKTVFREDLLIAPLPDQSNIHRVSGPSSDQTQYLVGGFTTFLQLNEILEGYFRTKITQYENVVDWGVGCARVARHFWESAAKMGLPVENRQAVLGLDIDEINIAWCKDNLANYGKYELLSLEGFSLPAESVDFLYGISVFTHLSEFQQHRWLQEIRRVLRPGGVAVVTIHGEGIYYRERASIALTFVEKFGFFDGIADAAIGKERETYYRASYHSRTYIEREWSRYFEIRGIIPMANAFRQDYVVLQRP